MAKASDELKIESGIPVPRHPSGRGAKSALTIALEQMSVGDSFLVPRNLNIRSVRSCVVEKLGSGCYAIRKVSEGYRVWRIK